MKVCIVTVYNSINSGSFWQAKALKTVLEKMGIEVVYLQRNSDLFSSSSKLIQLKKFLKRFIKYGPLEGVRQYRTFKEFAISQKEFCIIANNKKYYEDIDCFILGSDTIWNLDSKFFASNYRTYFGGIFDKEKVISYAASVGNTILETIKKYQDIPDMLEQMEYISVRDEETYKIVEQLTEKNIEQVCDPTMLLRKEDYQLIEKTPKENNYIFLYLFAPLNNEQLKELRIFADKRGLKIISGTETGKYYDECIVNAPYTFLNYMLYADYVITDTFHGTIFSANLEKEFIVINRNKKKVNDFLIRNNLEYRLVSINDEITSKLNQKVEYAKVNLQETREKSIQYLKRALNIK